ncbi:hypothetical protein M436DRAFT_78940 [Aureobasidium namibiae CBS 147.97]|uniref:Uncharacterized protein n=1 Tax=Aureobasidium namibiae CBS 147.97 TaxID=1043004 RepID=A0A074X580_9PEZI
MSAQQLQIPQVTEHDLRLFHDKHFASLSAGASNRHRDAHVDLEENYGDDGLGYYPDGVKRTLTDDQIAMFRHSEIQALLRERRRRRENSEGGTSHDASKESIQPVGDTRSPATADDTDRQRSASTSGSQGVGKRKWQRFIDSSESNPEHLTHRRIARELDEQKASSIDLAYGDDEDSTYPAATEKRSNAVSDAPDRREQVTYDEPASVLSASGSSNNPKFMWPTLGAKDGSSGD